MQAAHGIFVSTPKKRNTNLKDDLNRVAFIGRDAKKLFMHFNEFVSATGANPQQKSMYVSLAQKFCDAWNALVDPLKSLAQVIHSRDTQ